VAADAIVVNADPAALGLARRPEEPSLSAHAVLLGLRGRTPSQAHHTIMFPACYDAEFDDVFDHRRSPTDPTIYVSAPAATDPSDAPAGREAWFVLVNAPASGQPAGWAAYEERLIDRLGVRDRIEERARRTPADLERETGAPGGAIYGAAPHGRLAALRRPGNAVRGVRGAWLVGGSVHPGGGLPLVALGAATVAREIGPA
jgi:phytoene dehydrogenase-like protein